MDDRAAGNALVNRYFDEIARFFGRHAGDQHRQDLTQETFKKLTTAKATFRGSSSIRTFLFGIARHVLHDHYRSQKQSFDPLTHSLEDLGGRTPSRALASLHEHERLLGAMRALPVETKLLLEMYYWKDFTAAQVGEIHGIPEATVRTRVHAARAKLRQLVRAADGSPVDALAPEVADEDPEAEEDALVNEIRRVGELLAKGPRSI